MALAWTGAATAHEGHDDQVLGTVAAVGAGTISIETRDGKTVSIALDDETVVLRGDRTVAASDIVVGDRAVVSVSSKGGRHVATRVRLGPKGGR